MSTDGVSCASIYERILDWLRQNNASDTANRIRQCVARGVVVDPQNQTASKVIRSMNDQEQLAVALEFLISLLEAPLFIDATKHTLDCKELRWEPESLSTPAEPMVAPSFPGQEINELRVSLQKLIDIAVKMNILLPEIA